jgi:lambda repressor-like predicted transcriptional regulator
MHDLDTRHKFIELRAKGHSLDRISKHLGVSKRTLVEWSKRERETIRALRAVEIEALQEEIIASRETQLRTLQNNLNRIQEAIDQITYKYVRPEKLHRMAALVRAEIRKVCDSPDMIDSVLGNPAESEMIPSATKAETTAEPPNSGEAPSAPPPRALLSPGAEPENHNSLANRQNCTTPAPFPHHPVGQ